MPSSSKKQHNFMAAVANNPSFAKKAGVPQSVGKEFNNADKGKTFKQGGDMKPVDMKKNPGVAKLPTAVRNKMGFMKKGGMAEGGKSDMKQDKSMMQKAVNKHEGRLHKGSPMTKLAGGGMAASKMGSVKTSSTRDGVASKGKTKGTMIAMKKGGRAC
jgi:hypothetical protein